MPAIRLDLQTSCCCLFYLEGSVVTTRWSALEGKLSVVCLFLMAEMSKCREISLVWRNTAYLRLEGSGMLAERCAPLPTYPRPEALALKAWREECCKTAFPTPALRVMGENSGCLPAKEGLCQYYLWVSVKSQDEGGSCPRLLTMARNEGLVLKMMKDLLAWGLILASSKFQSCCLLALWSWGR